MPPRARKTAATKPAADAATLDAPETTPESVPTEADGATPETDGQAPTEPATVTDGGDETAAPVQPDPGAEVKPEPAVAADNPTVTSVEPDSAPEDPPGDTPEPTAPAFHWETSAGAPGDPCRLCLPGGIPETAGSIGCQHGQWVRVWDGNQ